MERSKDQKPNDDKNPNEDFRESIAKKARVRGFIKIIDLVSIMAAEKSYTDVLPRLCEIFCSRCFLIPKEYNGPDPEEESDDNDATGIWRESQECDISTDKGRNWFWMNLLRRWTGLAPDVVLKRLEFTQYIQYYQTNKVTGQLDKVDREQRKPDYFDDYVKLTDFAEYVEEIEKMYELSLPLPCRLFPESKDFHAGEAIFSCKPGTGWENVLFTLVSDYKLEIETPQDKGRFTYHDLQMADRRKVDHPNALWDMLKIAILGRGLVTERTYTYWKRNPYGGQQAKWRNTSFDKIMSQLNTHLQKLFGIDGSIYKQRLKGDEGKYSLQIKVDNKTSMKDPNEEMQEWYPSTKKTD